MIGEQIGGHPSQMRVRTSNLSCVGALVARGLGNVKPVVVCILKHLQYRPVRQEPCSHRWTKWWQLGRPVTFSEASTVCCNVWCFGRQGVDVQFVPACLIDARCIHTYRTQS